MKGLKKYRSDELHTIIYKKENPEDILFSEFGGKYSEYRRKWSRASQCVLTGDYPLHLNFELFFGCNLRCSMCLYSMPVGEWTYKAEPKKRISFEKYREIIDEGALRGLCAIQLNGTNEPLLQEDLVKYIDYAKEAGIMDIYIVTNATLLTRQKSEEILKSGLTQIKFSIDSISKKTYEKIRTGATFETTMDNINAFLKLKKDMGKKLPITRVSFVKTKENIGEVDDFSAYWAERVDYVAIQNMSDPFLEKEKYGDFEKKFRFDGAPMDKCPMPYQRMFIQNNGNVLPCCSTYGYNLPVGNIYKGSIREIWMSREMKELRTRVNGSKEEQPLPCRKCRLSMTHKSD